jgi:hypothetical protein
LSDGRMEDITTGVKVRKETRMLSRVIVAWL